MYKIFQKPPYFHPVQADLFYSVLYPLLNAGHETLSCFHTHQQSLACRLETTLVSCVIVMISNAPERIPFPPKAPVANVSFARDVVGVTEEGFTSPVILQVPLCRHPRVLLPHSSPVQGRVLSVLPAPSQEHMHCFPCFMQGSISGQCANSLSSPRVLPSEREYQSLHPVKLYLLQRTEKLGFPP